MKILFAMLCLIVGCVSAQAGDAQRGQQMYELQCISCHESTVHIREHSLVRDYAGIVTQVVRWQDTLGLNWSSVDIEDVAAYLNNAYYQFDCTAGQESC